MTHTLLAYTPLLVNWWLLSRINYGAVRLREL